MLGTSHAVGGAAAWLGLCAAADAARPERWAEWFPTEAAGITIGAFVAAGAALLPDIDQPGATVGRSVPVAGRAVATAVGRASGGHRKGMHSLLAVVGCVVLAALLARATVPVPGWGTLPAASALAVAACVAFAAKALRVCRGWIAAWMVGVAAGALVLLAAPSDPFWLPACIGAGYAAHLVGDLLTAGGVPLTWPLVVRSPAGVRRTPILRQVWCPSGAVALPLVGRTGSVREKILTAGLAVYVVWRVVVIIAG